ncbi:UDP-N-acetylglucosamine 2-epimerase [Candidatus Planktophila dulcis]|uniref:UDP-N-acetylglucosamine 2-epimerase n=1 Tax=Candidatus Planktophila dulcis TaxID=1884914 RepID=UPI000BAC6752|nr:UDP-N-acetylglucosamine 2-epimerase [Candidatus Planktophila dulcis]ASY14014.1 UDP-N-acetylglucosamine 2-epimerase [Candidatus Planktophila dulcis]
MNRKGNFLEVVVTARPSWARVKSLIGEYVNLTSTDSISLSLVGPAVSQRYGDIRSQAGFQYTVNSFPALQESDDFTGITLSCLEGAKALTRHWSSKRPDCVLVVADRTETLGVAAAAAIMQIPLIHLQGGEISGSIDDKIRDSNSKLADYHLTTNGQTKQELLKMGEPENRISVVGCPSLDLVSERIESGIDSNLFAILNNTGVGNQIDFTGKYGVVMFHPDTINEPENCVWVEKIIAMIKSSKIQWVWFWPNPDHGTGNISKLIRQGREDGSLKSVRFVINVTPEIFINLAFGANVLIGNSSFGIRESSFLGLPVINLGHRQNGRQRAQNVTDIPFPVSQEQFNNFCASEVQRYPQSHLYGDGTAGARAAKSIALWQPTLKTRTISL